MQAAVPEGQSQGRIAPWWVAVASLATLAIAIPATLQWAGGADPTTDMVEVEAEPNGSEFVLILRIGWSGDSGLTPDEIEKREDELSRKNRRHSRSRCVLSSMSSANTSAWCASAAAGASAAMVAPHRYWV